jgi:hypothetical protein
MPLAVMYGTSDYSIDKTQLKTQKQNQSHHPVKRKKQKKFPLHKICSLDLHTFNVVSYHFIG